MNAVGGCVLSAWPGYLEKTPFHGWPSVVVDVGSTGSTERGGRQNSRGEESVVGAKKD